MAGLTDILTTVQNGVTAMSAFTKQLQGSVNNISSQLTTISSQSINNVRSIDGKIGAFTTGNGLDTSVNVIEITAARRTLPTTQSLTTGTSATYTTPPNCLWIEVFMVGGGGGGAGASSTVLVAGSDGGASSFNSITAAGGKGATFPSSFPLAGAGGSGGTGTATRRSRGGPGENTLNLQPSTGRPTGNGGNSYFGGGALGVRYGAAAAGNSADANSGAGGSGANNSTGANVTIGSGGGAGEFVYLLINGPAGTYTYTIGTSGAGGVSTNNGGAGGTGFIFVIEHYGS